MKSVILALFVCVATVASAQSDTIRYIQIKYPTGGFSSKTRVEVDAGDSAAGWFKAAKLQKDAAGNDIKFTSGVDALNWYGARGWALVAYFREDLGTFGNKVEYQIFILSKKE